MTLTCTGVIKNSRFAFKIIINGVFSTDMYHIGVLNLFKNAANKFISRTKMGNPLSCSFRSRAVITGARLRVKCSILRSDHPQPC